MNCTHPLLRWRVFGGAQASPLTCSPGPAPFSFLFVLGLVESLFRVSDFFHFPSAPVCTLLPPSLPQPLCACALDKVPVVLVWMVHHALENSQRQPEGTVYLASKMCELSSVFESFPGQDNNVPASPTHMPERGAADVHSTCDSYRGAINSSKCILSVLCSCGLVLVMFLLSYILSLSAPTVVVYVLSLPTHLACGTV